MPRKRKQPAENISEAKAVDLEKFREAERGKELVTIQVPRAWCDFVKHIIYEHQHDAMLRASAEMNKPNSKTLPHLYKDIKMCRRAVEILMQQMRMFDKEHEGDVS